MSLLYNNAGDYVNCLKFPKPITNVNGGHFTYAAPYYALLNILNEVNSFIWSQIDSNEKT